MKHQLGFDNFRKDLQTDAEKPTISEVSVWNVSSTGYIVHCIVKY